MLKGIEVRPVNQSNWKDLENLFEARGSPHYCWCSLYRVSGKLVRAKADKKANLRQLVSNHIPVGVLAYDGVRPVGWCSVAPRETYRKLDRSRSMPRVTDPGTNTWSILCFFVHREYRGRHVSNKLIEGAVAYVRAEGARIVEGYPFDSAGTTATHRGHSRIYEEAGFSQDDRRWYLDLNRSEALH